MNIPKLCPRCKSEIIISNSAFHCMNKNDKEKCPGFQGVKGEKIQYIDLGFGNKKTISVNYDWGTIDFWEPGQGRPKELCKGTGTWDWDNLDNAEIEARMKVLLIFQ